MKTKLFLFFILTSSLFSLKGYAGGCAPNTTNGSCATAIAITPGAACINGTTCNGTGPAASSCLPAGSQCSWYSFVATATSMYVNINVTNTPGCYIASNVYAATGVCVGTEISCLAAGAPMDDVHSLTGLTIGATYYIQICESQFGPCAGDAALYCIEVGIPAPPCNTCSTPCGAAQGFATPPTVATVVAGCTTAPFVPELQPGSVNTFCNSFTATNATVSFNVIITSNCGAGNVTAFSWALYNSPACGGAIQTGTLASLTFTGLTVGNSYVFCYTFTVPAGCTHTQHCPYFVGATVLPISLTSFEANVVDNAFINLDWITASEINNDFFTIEKSKDGQTYEVVGIVDGAGNSNTVLEYETLDENPYQGTSYYRLKQTDFDGQNNYSKIVAVNIVSAFEDISIFPNPILGTGYLSFTGAANSTTTVLVYDISGRKVWSKDYVTNKGANQLTLETNELSQGMYFLTMSMSNGEENTTIKFIKE